MPVHPGRILRTDYGIDNAFSIRDLSEKANMSDAHIECLINEDERFPIKAWMALRLAKALNTTPEFWMNLQTAFDLAIAKEIWGE